MLTFRQIDDLPDSVIRLMAQAEQSIINDMARRIAKMGGVSDATQWQLFRLEAISGAQNHIVQELSRALRLTERQLVALFDEAATRATSIDNQMLKSAGYAPVPLSDNRYLQQMITAGLTKTKQSFENLTRTTARTATMQFERALDLAHMEMVSGGFDYQSTIKKAVKSLARNGLASIAYPTGHVDFLDIATRRAVLTGVSQTVAEISLANVAQVGVDLVETTAHAGSRPTHAVWQGKVFSLSGTHKTYPNFYTETGYGTGDGLCGWNCRHSFYPFFEGLSEPAYDKHKLDEYNNRTVKFGP